MQNYHKLKRIHANIVQNPTFLGRFQTFGGQCIYILYIYIYIYIYINVFIFYLFIYFCLLVNFGHLAFFFGFLTVFIS